MNNENKCVHDYFLASKTDELCKSKGYGGLWEYFKIGTLVCKRCADTQEVKLDVYVKQH